MKVIAVKYIEGYKLEVTFKNGKVVVADFSEFLKKATNPMITKYRIYSYCSVGVRR